MSKYIARKVAFSHAGIGNNWQDVTIARIRKVSPDCKSLLQSLPDEESASILLPYCVNPLHASMWCCLCEGAKLPDGTAVVADWVNQHFPLIKEILYEYKAANGFPPCPKQLFRMAFARTPVGVLCTAASAATQVNERLAKRAVGAKRKRTDTALHNPGGTTAAPSAASDAPACADAASNDPISEFDGQVWGAAESPPKIPRAGPGPAAASEHSPAADPDSVYEKRIIQWTRDIRDHFYIKLQKVNVKGRNSWRCPACKHTTHDEARIRKTVCPGFELPEADRTQILRCISVVRATGSAGNASKKLASQLVLPADFAASS